MTIEPMSLFQSLPPLFLLLIIFHPILYSLINLSVFCSLRAPQRHFLQWTLRLHFAWSSKPKTTLLLYLSRRSMAIPGYRLITIFNAPLNTVLRLWMATLINFRLLATQESKLVNSFGSLPISTHLRRLNLSIYIQGCTSWLFKLKHSRSTKATQDWFDFHSLQGIAQLQVALPNY